MTDLRLWDVLDDLKDNYDWVDLTHELSNDSPYWAGIPKGTVELGTTVFDWGNPMLDCLIQKFTVPGQFGTHIDFPGHFIKDGKLSESYGVKNMLYPLCVIDITAKVKADVHYAVTVDDLKAWEAQYGIIPKGAFVALRTDWAKNWPDMDKLSGVAADGSENFPGWSIPALEYIYDQREAAASGHETLDTDASALAAQAGDLACERYVLGKGKLQVEVINNLDKVAPAGAILFVAWMNIVGATGMPVRMMAITPKAGA